MGNIDLNNLLEQANLIKEMLNLEEKNIDENKKKEVEIKEEDKDFKVSKKVLALNKILPYLEYKQQRNISIVIKILELKNILDSYDSNQIKVQSYSKENRESIKSKMLEEVKPYISPEKEQKLNMILQLLELQTILKGDDDFEC